MRIPMLSLCSTVLVLAGCSTETVAPTPTVAPRDLRSNAFQLTMALTPGTVRVGAPGAASGPSASLVGAEGVLITSSGGITCEAIPRASPQQKRCSFDLEIMNYFADVDLMPPTDFPRPPAGASGVLVFPWSASSDGTGGSATASPDWDKAPANFFNDFVNCSGASQSDCYRYELIPSPFRAGTTYRLDKVGFDVPADAKKITAYLVIAANLRDNPILRTEQSATGDLCGYVFSTGEVFRNNRLMVVDIGEGGNTAARGFCSFLNVFPMGTPVEIVRASLGFFPYTDDYLGYPARAPADFTVELLDYGSTMESTDFTLPSPPVHLTAISRCCVSDRSSADVTRLVQEAANQSARWFQFRLTPLNNSGAFLLGSGYAIPSFGPKLVIEYRLK